MSIHHFANRRERFYQLFIIHSHTNQQLHLLFHQIKQRAIIIPFIRSPGNPNHRSVHTIQSIPSRIHVCCLRIIYVSNSIHHVHRFQTMFHLRESCQSFSQILVTHPCLQCSQYCCHSVIHVMPSLDRNLLFGNTELPIAPPSHYRVPIHVSVYPYTIRVSKPDSLRYDISPFHSLSHHFTIITIYKQILLPHIIQYPEL